MFTLLLLWLGKDQRRSHFRKKKIHVEIRNYPKGPESHSAKSSWGKPEPKKQNEKIDPPHIKVTFLGEVKVYLIAPPGG